MNDPFRAATRRFHAQNTTVKVSDRTDRPITTIATVSDVQTIDIQGMGTDEPKHPAAPCAAYRDSKPEPKAPKTTAPTTTIPTGKSAQRWPFVRCARSLHGRTPAAHWVERARPTGAN